MLTLLKEDKKKLFEIKCNLNILLGSTVKDIWSMISTVLDIKNMIGEG